MDIKKETLKHIYLLGITDKMQGYKTIYIQETKNHSKQNFSFSNLAPSSKPTPLVFRYFSMREGGIGSDFVLNCSAWMSTRHPFVEACRLLESSAMCLFASHGRSSIYCLGR